MNAEEIAHYIQQLHSPDSENAYNALLTNTATENVPALIAAYDAERNAKVKARLIEIIWQKRAPDSLRFLDQALQRPEAAVWRAALDGIVAIGGEKALALLETEKRRMYSNLSADMGLRADWIDEAIDRISRDSAG